MALRAGISGAVTVGGTQPPITGWRVNPTATLPEFRNSLTGAHPRRLSTFKDSEYEYMVDWDDTNNLFGTPYNLVPGMQAVNTKLNIDGAGGTLYWSYPSSYIQGMPMDLEVAGKIMTRVRALADGQYAAPGQALA